MFETILKKNLVFLSIYLYIYENLKFHIPKTLSHPSTLRHPSTLSPKSRLVNPKVINVFYPSLKVRVKVVSVIKILVLEIWSWRIWLLKL